MILKKKHMQRIDNLKQQVEYYAHREKGRREEQAEMFETALSDLEQGSEVLIITQSGLPLRATMLGMDRAYGLIDIGSGVAPGPSDVRLELSPHPE